MPTTTNPTHKPGRSSAPPTLTPQQRDDVAGLERVLDFLAATRIDHETRVADARRARGERPAYRFLTVDDCRDLSRRGLDDLLEDPVGHALDGAIRDVGRFLAPIGGVALMHATLERVAENADHPAGRVRSLVAARWDGISDGGGGDVVDLSAKARKAPGAFGRGRGVAQHRSVSRAVGPLRPLQAGRAGPVQEAWRPDLLGRRPRADSLVRCSLRRTHAIGAVGDQRDHHERGEEGETTLETRHGLPPDLGRYDAMMRQPPDRFQHGRRSICRPMESVSPSRPQGAQPETAKRPPRAF
ncbi:hypothetical protein [Methylobacterium nodulans]|uniref:hypothetical protein n=1 Tax=Methylobacterium nodulans TaxID=114616 RepID=UPI0005C1B4E2|nr:hypothetical protein [Methylobacterium nodulans]